MSINTFSKSAPKVSPDSSKVVFVAGRRLYSAPLSAGGTATSLNPKPVTNGRIRVFKLTPDGSRVLYVADLETWQDYNLYSVPISGGTSLQLNPRSSAGPVEYEFYISPDSSRAIYVADQNARNCGRELYSVPVDGSARSIQISGPLIECGFIARDDLTITPDSQFVLYRAEGTSDGRYDLFYAPIDGHGPAAKLNYSVAMVGGSPISTEFVGFRITADSRHVVYRASNMYDWGRELYVNELTRLDQRVYLPQISHN